VLADATHPIWVILMERRPATIGAAMRRPWKLGATALVALVWATMATAAPSPKTDARIAAMVPAKIRAKGTLLVATAASSPPYEFVRPNGRAIVGMDPDLVKALATVMGLRARIVNVRFDTIIKGVASGEYDVGMSSITDTKAREEIVDFVTYFSAGTSFFGQANIGQAIKSLADLCGYTVAVVRGTTQERDVERQSIACRKAGQPDLRIAIFGDHNAVYIALKSSNDDAVGLTDSPVAAYSVKHSRGELALSGEPYDEAPYGIALPKGSGLARPILAALKKLMADGTYRAILTKWGIQSGAIANPRINGATG
jgi:polar amino acid transport system substrate-binding protein